MYQCETPKYVITSSDWLLGDTPLRSETEFKLYPDAPGGYQQRTPLITLGEATGNDGKLQIPPSVWNMYKESIDALNQNIRTLAGGGLRATVEAICQDKNIRTGNLQSDIEEFAKHNLLTSAQVQLLHEERYWLTQPCIDWKRQPPRTSKTDCGS